MSYVEWLRVRNCLRTVAIVLAVIVALGIVLRVSVARYMSPQELVHRLSRDPGSTERHVTLPDGTRRTIFDDPRQATRVVIDDRGSAGRHIVITEPSSRAHKDDSNFKVGSVQVANTKNGAVTTTVIDTNGSVPMIYYMAIADVFALIVATILAAPLAREENGHLEIALTKPCSRVRYALGVIGTDIAGIVAASVLTIVAIYLCQLLFETPRLDFGGLNARAIVMGLAMPIAWYAMLCAATTWLGRSYFAVLAFAWPAAILVGALTLVAPVNALALFVHDVAWVLSRLDPLSYVALSMPGNHGNFDDAASTFPARLGIEALLFVAYVLLALLRWQRVEA